MRTWVAALGWGSLMVVVLIGLMGCGSGKAKKKGEFSSVSTKKLLPNFAYEFNAAGVVVWPVDASTGDFGTSPQSVTVSNGNGGTVDPQGKFLFALAATTPSQVVGYKINSSTGMLTATAQGAVNLDASIDTIPTRAVTDPSGKHLYILNESVSFPSISVFSINSTSGALTQIGGSPYTIATNPRDIAMHPSGKYLYVAFAVTNPTANVLPYTINTSTGALTPGTGVTTATGSSFPLALVTDAKGKYLYVMEDADNVDGFAISSTNGSLTALTNSPYSTPGAANPSALGVSSNEKFLFVGLAPTTNNLYAEAINSASGDIGQVSGSPYTAFSGASGDDFGGVTVDPSNKFLYIASAFASNGIDGFSIDSSSGQLTHISSFPIAGINDTNIAITAKTQ